MVLEELATGLFLDLPIQNFVMRFTGSSAGNFLLIDALHGEDYLKLMSLVSYQASLSKSKVIYNPPLQNGGGGTGSTSTGTGVNPPVPVPGTVSYRVAFYKLPGNYIFAKIKNNNDGTESYLIRRKDLDFWNNTLNAVQNNYYG